MALSLSARLLNQRRSELSSALSRVDVGLITTRNSRQRAQQRVLDANLFATAITREQKRVDRSDKAFALLTIEVTEGQSPELMREAASAVATATRAGDIVGWLRPDESLGVLLTDIRELDFALVNSVEGRIRQDLATFVGVPDHRRFAVRLHVHTSGRRGAAPPHTPRARAHDAVKRVLDLSGGAALLTMLSPLLLLIAAAVKLTSRGPVLFRQERVGHGMKPFTMLKFRTMCPDGGHALHQAYVTQFIKGGRDSAAAPGVFKLIGDTRVTPIGRFLRKTSLDELPQLWNVIVGDMSLVGPRPPIKYEVDQYKGWHLRRVFDAKPGLTGLWQVTGRSRTTFDEMVRLDLQYARTVSVWSDLKILLATPRAVVAGKGAC
jgi:lipopolysaccharide/colanic/teichoic acid biosynthesis glycosyltransferase